MRSWSDSAAQRRVPASVIDPFQEPLVAADIAVELAQQVTVEHRLPIFADNRLLPPPGFDLPSRDGVDRSAERAGDEYRRTAVIKRDSDWGGRREQARHRNFWRQKHVIRNAIGIFGARST